MFAVLIGVYSHTETGENFSSNHILNWVFLNSQIYFSSKKIKYGIIFLAFLKGHNNNLLVKVLFTILVSYFLKIQKYFSFALQLKLNTGLQ